MEIVSGRRFTDGGQHQRLPRRYVIGGRVGGACEITEQGAGQQSWGISPGSALKIKRESALLVMGFSFRSRKPVIQTGNRSYGFVAD